MSIAALESPAGSMTAMTARRWRIAGRVQGVGFRPFVYRLAHQFELGGWVRNSGGVVEIHAQGPADRLRAFGEALLACAPPTARPRLLDAQTASAIAAEGFRILASAGGAQPYVHVPPDLFTCDDCLAELRDRRARRYRYPFINCTQCGPRYTLIRALPYDRANTTMERFVLCADCARGICRSARPSLPRAAARLSGLWTRCALEGRHGAGGARQRSGARGRSPGAARRTDRGRPRHRWVSPAVRCCERERDHTAAGPQRAPGQTARRDGSVAGRRRPGLRARAGSPLAAARHGAARSGAADRAHRAPRGRTACGGRCAGPCASSA